ncbi:MAG: acetylornithine deacetylase [Gammaproteobacteria bacterium]
MSLTAPTLMQMLHALIAAPSVSSVSPQFDQSNRGVIELLTTWLEGLGFRCEILPLPQQPDKFDLIATLGSGPDGLVLAGHTDTVPYDHAGWRSDPFTLSAADNRLYGLGMSDMKAFFALAIEAARRFRAQDLRAPLILVATADEESSMEGALELVRAGRPKGRFAVIGEPTNLKPMRMHKGILMEAIRLHGRSGHSSDPSLGVNALEGMHKVIGALLALRAELQAKYQHAGFAVPVPTMNFGHIHGGDNPNRICADCELHIDLRPLPGMDLEELRALLKQRTAAALAGSELRWEVTPLFCGTPAMETPAASPLVLAAEQLTGAAAGAVAFGTEGPYFQALGMDALILGPGDIAQAHQPNEYLSLDRIDPTVELLGRLIERFCVQGAPP